MAYIEKKRSGSKPYRVRYRGPDGKLRSRSFARRPDAVRFRATVEADMTRGEWVDPRLSKTTFAVWAERWMNAAAHLKPKTRAGYESMLRAHLLPRFGRMPLAGIDVLAIQEWIAAARARGLSASRVRAGYYLLSAMFKTAVGAQYVSRTPCVGIKLPRLPRHEMLFLSAAEVERLAEAAADTVRVSERDEASAEGAEKIRRRHALRTLVYVFAYGGLRWGELAGLRRRHCAQLMRSRIEVSESLAEVSGKLFFGPTKTYQVRSVILPAPVCDMLAKHLQSVPLDPHALVFTAPKEGPLRHGNFRRNVWIPALRRAGLSKGFRIHDLRHTCAALLIASDLQPKIVQTHLGHSSIQVTLDRYGHLYPDAMERVAAVMEEKWHRGLAESRQEKAQDHTAIAKLRRRKPTP